MFDKFMKDLVDPSSFKVKLSERSMIELSQQPNVLLIRSDVMYRIYLLYAETQGYDKISKRTDFYRKCGLWLYYEKFICRHGDEYYYYVKLNDKHPFYQEHSLIINGQILATDPKHINDYIGTKNLLNYNKSLKEGN